jgi:hypothetical protein
MSRALHSYIVTNEGWEEFAFDDGVGGVRIGIGFNLSAAGARGRIEAVGADYDEIMVGYGLTAEQINALFAQDAASAHDRLYAMAREGARIHHSAAETILIDLSYGFPDIDTAPEWAGFRRALNALDLSTMADELKTLKYFREPATKRRFAWSYETLKRHPYTMPDYAEHKPLDSKAGIKDAKESKDGKDGKDTSKDAKEQKESPDKTKEQKDSKDSKDDKESPKETSKDMKETKDEKENGKEQKDASKEEKERKEVVESGGTAREHGALSARGGEGAPEDVWGDEDI